MPRKKQPKPPAPVKASTRFGGYEGKKLWKVTHPSYRTVVVAAPDEPAAIYTAAGLWQVDWTRIAVYAYAQTQRVKLKEAKA